jgi:hypothetical protein
MIQNQVARRIARLSSDPRRLVRIAFLPPAPHCRHRAVNLPLTEGSIPARNSGPVSGER